MQRSYLRRLPAVESRRVSSAPWRAVGDSAHPSAARALLAGLCLWWAGDLAQCQKERPRDPVHLYPETLSLEVPEPASTDPQGKAPAESGEVSSRRGLESPQKNSFPRVAGALLLSLICPGVLRPGPRSLMEFEDFLSPNCFRCHLCVDERQPSNTWEGGYLLRHPLLGVC